MEKNILSFEKKLIYNIKYMNNNTLDEGVEVTSKPKRFRRTKHTYKLSDIKKEDVEKVNPFNDLEIVENIDFNDVDKYNDKLCVFMFSRDIHNINDIFHSFLSKYNIIPKVDKVHKTNIMQFTHKIKELSISTRLIQMKFM